MGNEQEATREIRPTCSPAKRQLKYLASGTWAWFADEPTHELAWYQFIPGGALPLIGRVGNVSPLTVLPARRGAIR